MSLEQNESRSVKTSALGRRRRLAIWVVPLLAVAIGAVLLGWHGCVSKQNGSTPPAPDAPEAGQWKPPTSQPDVQPPIPPETPTHQWPEGWSPPLEILIDDIPEIPEEINGPSPPIETAGEADDSL